MVLIYTGLYWEETTQHDNIFDLTNLVMSIRESLSYQDGFSPLTKKKEIRYYHHFTQMKSIKLADFGLSKKIVESSSTSKIFWCNTLHRSKEV